MQKRFLQWGVARELQFPFFVRMNHQSKLNRWIALLVVTGVTVYLSWKILEPFFEVLILGIALVVIFNPVHLRMLRWTRQRPVLASGLSTLFTLLAIAIPFAFVIWVISRELGTAVDTFRDGVVHFRDKWDASATQEGWMKSLRDTLNLDEYLSPEKIKEAMSGLSPTILGTANDLVRGILTIVVKFIFLLFVVFFLFRDGKMLSERLLEFVPLPRDQALQLGKRTEEVLSACVYGVLMVAAIQGALGGLTFACLGLPSPATWAVVMTLLCTLPIVGAWVVWVPAAVGLALDDQYGKAIILALVGQFVISSIDGFLRPVLVGQRAKLHELVIFFSVLGGLKYFGLLGILMGPVVMAISYSLLSALWRAPVILPSAESKIEV